MHKKGIIMCFRKICLVLLFFSSVLYSSESIRGRFPIPRSLKKVDSWGRYSGGFRTKPEYLREITKEHRGKISEGNFAFYTRLAHIYANENQENKNEVKKLFLQCAQAIMNKNLTSGGMTYIVNDTRIETTTLYMSSILKSANLYDGFVKKWLMFGKFLDVKNPILNMDWLNKRVPVCWSFVANMNDSRIRTELLEKLQVATSKVIERVYTPDGGAIHHFCDHISYSSDLTFKISTLARNIHNTDYKLSKFAIRNMKAFAKARALASVDLYSPGNLSARATLEGVHFKQLPNILLDLYNMGSSKGSYDYEMLQLFLNIEGRHNSWKGQYFNQGFKKTDLVDHFSLNVSSAAIHRRNDWVVSIDGNRNPFKGIEMYVNPGEARTFMRNSCFGSMQILNRNFADQFKKFSYDGWDYNHFPGVTSQYKPFTDLMVLRNVEQIKNESSFAQGVSLDKNGMLSMIINDEGEVCRKSFFCFDNRITVLTTGIKVGTGSSVSTTLFQNKLTDKELPLQINGRLISDFPLVNNTSLSDRVILKDHFNNSYFVHSSSNSILSVKRSSQVNFNSKELKRNAPQRAKILKEKNKLTRDEARELLTYCEPQSGNYSTAYVKHEINDSKLLYTVYVDSDVERNISYKVLSDTNYAHILYDTPSKVTCYSIFNPAYISHSNLIKSSNSPVTLMAKESENGYLINLNKTNSEHDRYTQGLRETIPDEQSLILYINGEFSLVGEFPRVQSTTIKGTTKVTILHNGSASTYFELKKLQDANTAPVISDLTSTSATIGLSPNVTSLSVSATDAEGDELSYNWSVSGPGSYTIGNGKSTVEASFKSVGTYTITVQVSDGKLTSSKSTEIKVVNTAPVISNLSATSSSIGVSPDSTSLSVTATDAEGDELSYNWSVSGPGSYTIENSKSTVEASFKSAGTYKATVVVSDGNLTSSKSIEIDVVDSTNDPIFTDKGTLEITQENSGSWKTVELTKEYVDPVIIMSPLTYNGGNPAVVRVNNVTNKSFDFQVEEWDYLDGYHTKENVQYIVLEAGEYELSGGRKLIAGNVNVRDDFSLKYFNEELKDDVPVVLTQIISENDSSTAVVRLQNVSYKSFEVKLQSQESFKKSHSEEKVSFLAIDSGAYDEMGIKAVGKITDKVRHSWYKFEYQQEFTDVPNFFASIQTTKGEDPVALRVKDATAISINVKLEEEQSKDKEIRHTKEDIGYILFNLK